MSCGQLFHAMGSAETIFDPDGDIVLILNGQPTGMGLSADCKTEGTLRQWHYLAGI